MKKLRVIINKEPYIGMILEAAQAYHKETFGMILGKRIKKENVFQYDNLIQIFTPVRSIAKYTELRILQESYEKATSVIPTNSIKILGDFHTHTAFQYKKKKKKKKTKKKRQRIIYSINLVPSDEDIDDLKKQGSKYYFSLIMKIRPSEAKSTGFLYKDNELIYITDIYSRRAKNKKKRIKTRLAAFYLDKIKGELKPIKAELEPSRWLTDLIDQNPLDKRRKQKTKETLEEIAQSINGSRQQED